MGDNSFMNVDSNSSAQESCARTPMPKPNVFFTVVLAPVLTLLVSLSGFYLPAAQAQLSAEIEVVEGEPASVTDEGGSADRPNANSSTRTYSSAPAYGAPSGGANAEMFVQLQALQAEVRELRGLLEQQSYTIEQLSQRRMDDYLDLDRRIGELSGAAPRSTHTPSKSGSINKAPRPDNKSDDTTVAPSSGPVSYSTSKPENKIVSAGAKTAPVAIAANEADKAKQAYRAAYQKVKDRQFDQARVALVGFIGDHPGSHYIPNAYFWLGELYYLESDLEESKESFTVLITQHPEHRKVADAKFKLGKVYHQLGDQGAAREMLESVLSDHPGSTAANPAREYLNNSLR